MSSKLSYLLVPLLAITGLYFYTHTQPSTSIMTGDLGTWADGPYALIGTPRAKLNGKPETKASQLATYMAIVHNVLIRGLNSITVQAPHVPAAEVDAFMAYCSAWALAVHNHHDNEEAVEFPLIEELAGAKGIMGRNVEQHAAFLPGLRAFEDYVDGVQEGGHAYDGARLGEIVAGFAQPLRDHLADEIPTLEALEQYPGFDWEKYHAVAHKNSKDSADRTREIPFIMTNHDVTFEGGIHGRFPPFPGFVHTIFQWWYVPTLKQAWEFSCSDASGTPRPLKYGSK